MHLPSEEKLWHIPAALQLPISLPFPLRSTPELVQETSYLAASLNMDSFSIMPFCCGSYNSTEVLLKRCIMLYAFHIFRYQNTFNHFQTFVCFCIISYICSYCKPFSKIFTKEKTDCSMLLISLLPSSPSLCLARRRSFASFFSLLISYLLFSFTLIIFNL